MSVTIKDVAKKANVSISTVSRVINNTQKVKDEHKNRVLDAIDELNYQPNDIARSLVTKKSKLIAVIVSDIGRPYLAEILRGIEEVGKLYGYDILLFNTFENIEEEKRYIKWLKSKQVDGVIIASDIYNQNHLDFLEIEEFPTRFISRTDYHNKFSNVKLPIEEAFKEGLDFLFSNDLKDIIYLGVDPEKKYYYENIKENVYKQYMVDNNLDSHTIYVSELDYSTAYEVVNNMDFKGRKTIIASNDEFALAAMNALLDKGFKVPDDYNILGFGNITISTQVRPQLSTITYSFYDMGALTMGSLIKEIKNKDFCLQSSILDYNLIVRETIKTRRDFIGKDLD